MLFDLEFYAYRRKDGSIFVGRFWGPNPESDLEAARKSENVEATYGPFFAPSHLMARSVAMNVLSVNQKEQGSKER